MSLKMLIESLIMNLSTNNPPKDNQTLECLLCSMISTWVKLGLSPKAMLIRIQEAILITINHKE